MGRHSTPPEVVPEPYGLGFYGIRRVLDPDDEFATEQWLSAAFDDEFTWKEYPGSSGLLFPSEQAAEQALRVYRLGYEDAAGRASVPWLGN